jgi:mersacidin/lichenicidin family type 2 lantibiotic
MKKERIVRAWKDPEYRASLSPEERAALPESPSGNALPELGEADLIGVHGGVLAELEPATGCTGPVRETCGIVLCSLTES